MHKQYRQTSIILGKCGMTPAEVLNLTHYEANWWLDSYLDSIGVKRQQPIISLRKKGLKTATKPPKIGLKQD